MVIAYEDLLTVARLQAHIGAILISKITTYQDFHTQLYTCSPEFDMLPLDYWLQVTATLLLPAVVLVVARVTLSLLQHSYSEQWGRPSTSLVAEQAYYVIQCLAFALLALFIMRLKLFLTLQLCVLVAFLARSKVDQFTCLI